MSLTVTAHLVYLVLAGGLTVWVATTLSRSGRVVLTHVLAGDDALAEAVDRLLVVGFYLLSFGLLLLSLRAGGPVSSWAGLVESVSTRTGAVMLLLGMVHLLDVLVLHRIRRRARESRRTPLPQTFLPSPSPVAPTTYPVR